MSASSRPTEAPSRASATARFTATVLLPTPPLPDATAMTFFTPGSSCSAVRGAARRTVAPQVRSTDSTPIGSSAGVHARLDLVLERAGRRRQLDLERDLRAVDAQVPDHVRGSRGRRPSSGSWTCRSASMTAASVICSMRAEVLERLAF